MRRLTPLLLILALGLAFGTGCDLSSEESGTVTLTGQVLERSTNEPIAGAFIRVIPTEGLREFDEVIVETDENGRFSVEVKVDATIELRLVANDDEHSSETVVILAVAGRTVEVPTFRLTRTREEELESGTPSNILLVGQTNDTIGVIESGSVEITNVTFQVVDSAGRPITLDNEALVRFRLGQQPGGGEFIAPSEAPTDNSGIVTVNLSSGTKAGAVQVIAEFTKPDGSVVRSKPVNVTIHGGLPHQDHFTLGPDRFNFPGLLRFGLTNPVSVLVGDKYANPVRPGTSVYLTSTHGVIEGSIETNNQGQGSVNLISGNPLPPDGIAIVEAETAGNIDPNDNAEQRVTSRFPVVFSGFIVLDVAPAQAILGQTYLLRVTDQNGNPLAEGTQISVRAQGTKVKAVGNTAVTLDDTIITGFTYNDVVRGPGYTEFTFRVVEDLNIIETGSPTLEAVTIRVSGPNGSLEAVMTAGGVQARTAGAHLEALPDGRAIVQAPH